MAANENKAKPEALEIGISKDAGGAIFAGISPNTNQPMYVAPADASMRLGFNAAARYAAELEVGGQKGFRLPTKEELDVLFLHKDKGALKGSFNLAGASFTSGFYWSSLPCSATGSVAQRFSDGVHAHTNRSMALSVRCVRG